jgi:hypothetical protein
VRFLERFGNCEMEWTQESTIELIELCLKKKWDPKHPMHFNKSSDYNLILNFFHKQQIITYVFPVCNPSIFQQELHKPPHDAADCLLGNFEEVLQANVQTIT